jgi:hypothetical protein
MKAMVLPKKQLLYILEKQGFKLIGEELYKTRENLCKASVFESF